MGGQRLPLEPDRGEPEGEGLAEPYPSARRSQSSAVRAPEVGEHDALEGARPCRARIRPAAELDGRQDCAHHWHRAGEVSLSFWAFLAGCCSHPSGVLPALIASFSSLVLRCLGTDTIVASMICPPRAM